MAASSTSFKKGQSGNPGGRPKGYKTYFMKSVIAEAMQDPQVRRQLVEEFKRVLVARKTVLPAMEFAARVNKEIGQGSGEATGNVTIILASNIRPEKLDAARSRALPV